MRTLLTEAERGTPLWPAIERCTGRRWSAAASIPPLQGVRTVVYTQALAYTKYDTGHILPHRYSFRG